VWRRWQHERRRTDYFVVELSRVMAADGPMLLARCSCHPGQATELKRMPSTVTSTINGTLREPILCPIRSITNRMRSFFLREMSTDIELMYPKCVHASAVLASDPVLQVIPLGARRTNSHARWHT